jgi:hypothetical protein
MVKLSSVASSASITKELDMLNLNNWIKIQLLASAQRMDGRKLQYRAIENEDN